MWTIKTVTIITLSTFVKQAEMNKTNNTNLQCNHLLIAFFTIICFLSLLIFILLLLLIKMFKAMQKTYNPSLRRDTIHLTSINEEPTALPQNDLCVSPTSGAGADNSSSTSSGTPGGSLADLSCDSQRYVSLQKCQKMSDYINVSESAASARTDCTANIDYVNVKEPRRKKGNRKGARCDAGTTNMSSEESDESSINYSKVVFTTK